LCGVVVFSHSVATSSAECNRCSPPLQLGLGAAADNMILFGVCHKDTRRLLQPVTSIKPQLSIQNCHHFHLQLARFSGAAEQVQKGPAFQIIISR